MLVSAATATAFGDDDGVANGCEVMNKFLRGVIKEEGADGDFEDLVFAVVAGAVGA